MGNLVDAQIFFDIRRGYPAQDPAFDEYDHHQHQVPFGYTNVRNLFHRMRNVLNLVLFPATTEVLLCDQVLRSLGIKSDRGCGWQAMPALLRNCPRLETLVTEGLMHDVTWCGGFCCCLGGLSLGCCPVKLMKIHGFRGTMKEMAMLEYFLHYLPCLEEVRVYVEENSPTTELENHQVSKPVLKMFQLYNKSSRSRCNVKLMVGDVLCV